MSFRSQRRKGVCEPREGAECWGASKHFVCSDCLRHMPLSPELCKLSLRGRWKGVTIEKEEEFWPERHKEERNGVGEGSKARIQHPNAGTDEDSSQY